MKKFNQKTLNQNGQGIMEYVILTALIGIFCLGAVKQIGSRTKTKLNNIENKIQDIEIK